jgi:hypothetical protein
MGTQLRRAVEGAARIVEIGGMPAAQAGEFALAQSGEIRPADGHRAQHSARLRGAAGLAPTVGGCPRGAEIASGPSPIRGAPPK